MDRYGILKPFIKWAYFPTISKPGAKRTYFRFLDIFLYFFMTTSYYRTRPTKIWIDMEFYGLPKMGLLPIHIQTQSQKKIIFDFRYFSLFFLTNLILTDQVDKNMDRYGILWPSRKWA